MPSDDSIFNQGVITSFMPARDRRHAPREKTLLITGLARSGTSMLAALLEAAGIWLGDHVYEPINEDAEITQMLQARDFTRLDALVERQNANTPIWGFKLPDLQLYIQHDELRRFRNPHLIAIFRDPVAVAARNAISEQYDPTQAMIEATTAIHALAQFVRAARVPFLLLSYEKALLLPRAFIDNVLAFCGIDLDETLRAGLLQHVQPNRSQYVSTSKRSFEGNLEGISNNQLIGWARHVGNLTPVLLDFLIDDKLAATFQATDFRDDLLAAGMGNGNHAFSFDLAGHRISDASRIRVRFNRRTVELANSGMSAAALRALREPR
jgi:hypothetical protein